MMKGLEANDWRYTITCQASDFLRESLKETFSLQKANQKMYDSFGIIHFFESEEDFIMLKDILSFSNNMMEEPERAEYGDFQTNVNLANEVTKYLVSKDISPEIVIEPTCGKGNFIIASLRHFTNIKYIIGVEIYKPYVWETKFNIVDFFLSNPNVSKPEISIIHCNVFDFDFKTIAKKYATNNVLVLGNPPWVTNSKLGSLNSTNLPKKTNFKNQSGLDAMTGKGNFDIAEFITLTMIETFQNMKGNIVLLVKNSVIKNIIFEQNKNRYKISTIEKHSIDSKKEFNVAVEAALFFCKLNSEPAFNCLEFNFYDKQKALFKFGWFKDKFVSNIEMYAHTKEIDGECPYVWRQGLKHDCSNVMELEKVADEYMEGYYLNGLGETVQLEDDLVYGILKSSDLKNTVISQTRKFTIVTQRKVGQDTSYIKTQYPQTHQYLTKYRANFEARKSSIYDNKPSFSIFGIGDYSFKPFKVAISGLYKTFHFTLILPQNDKPVMLDDTCYLLGFDQIEFAVYALILLNSSKTTHLLQSLTFPDAKRTFTKDVLMRIDLLALSRRIDKLDIQVELEQINLRYKLNLSLDLWDNFIDEMTPIKSSQLSIFA